ncbi:MAG: cytochrome c oxidase subunit II [Planctomycetota bacterium]|jgi:cytochrome c oxidase subunit 2
MHFLLADKVPDYAWFPTGASNFVPQVDFLFWAIMWISAAFFIPIVIAMGYFMWKYRDRPGYRGSPEALHNTPLEITWTVIPTAIVVWIFWEGAVGYLDMTRIPKGTVDVQVNAKKWAWNFKYSNGGEDSILCIPVNKDVKLIMRSEDVLHSFYIPSFRAKRDVVPGRYSYMWFRPTKEGIYDLFCTEYCGDNHSGMITKVQVVSDEEYAKFLEKAIREPEDPLERGKLLYKRKGCATCHNAAKEGANGPGPSYNGSWGKTVPLESGSEVAFDENYVRESILNPTAKKRKGYGAASPMNSYAGQLKDEQIDALITFIKSLENEAPPAK